MVLLAVTIASLVQWQQGHVKGAIAAGVVVLAGFALVRWLARPRPDRPRRAAALERRARRRRSRSRALGAGWWEQNHYLERRYENTSPELKLADALRWARDVRDARIAVAGIRGVFNQYPFYGTDLSNQVQWLGRRAPTTPTCGSPPAPSGARRSPTATTPTWSPPTTPTAPTRFPTRRRPCGRARIPAATEILRDGPVSVFEIDGAAGPGRVRDLPELSAAELNGDSVNAEPLANQP